MPSPAEGMAFLVEGDIIRGIFRSFRPAVDIDGIDVPVFQEPVSRDVVMRGVEADVFGGKSKTIAPEVINRRPVRISPPAPA